MPKQEFWKGLVAGSAAGLAGSVAMTLFQNLWSKASRRINSGREGQAANSESGSDQNGEDATMKAAGKMAETLGYRLSVWQPALCRWG